jgi:hypothetical protein
MRPTRQGPAAEEEPTMSTSARPRAVPALVVLLAVWLLAPAAPAQEPQAEAFSEGELAQMLAPVALYPDTLLSQILMAATYPLEVVEAARWSRDNPHLEGAEAVDAVADQDWDPSVKALVAFPGVLARMNEDLSWTRNLGDAFLLQEEDVADMIQELRQRAYEAGHLDGQEHIRVVREREVIVIEPAHPRVVYVPYYYPTVVYGGWWWPAYAPVYWYPPYGYSLSIGITWVGGVPVSHGFFFSSFHWPLRHVVIVHTHHHHVHVGKPRSHRWRHDPRHRRGVAYRHPALKARFPSHVSSGSREVLRPGTGSRFSGSPVSAWHERRLTDERARHHRTAPRTDAHWQDRHTSRERDTRQVRDGRQLRDTRDDRTALHRGPGSTGQRDGDRARRLDGRTARHPGAGDRPSGHRTPGTPTERITPRRPATPAPDFRDRARQGQHTEAARRSLESRRPTLDRRDAGRPETAWRSRSDPRSATGGRGLQRPDNTRVEQPRQARPDSRQRTHREAAPGNPSRGETGRPAGRPERSARQAQEGRDNAFGRPLSGQGQRQGLGRGDGRSAFTR